VLHALPTVVAAAMSDDLDRALDRIRAEIAGGRRLYTADEVVDLLLDLRQQHHARLDAIIAAARQS
jgi:hypothetical protein